MENTTLNSDLRLDLCRVNSTLFASALYHVKSETGKGLFVSICEPIGIDRYMRHIMSYIQAMLAC